MKKYDTQTIVFLHDEIIKHYGGLGGIKNYSLLEACLSSGFAGFGDIELYKTTLEKIAKIAFSIIKNHPFNDGNKRTGIATMEFLLNLNNKELIISDDELYDITMDISTDKADEQKLSLILKQHTKHFL